MHWFGPLKLLLCLTLFTFCQPVEARLAVMSVDLGGEFIKTAIVKPGVPMEIVLDKDSSRKTRTIVAFRDGERIFANEAYNTAVRFPAKAFWFLTQITGRSYDDPLVQKFQKRFPYYKDVMVKDADRGTVLFKMDDDTLYSTEELLGMILESARQYAQDFAEEGGLGLTILPTEQNIKDAVIVVPTYYNQAERRAILTAAELVGINVLQLMSSSAAVALNYGVFRRKIFNTTAQYYMFFDMGATSTVVTVVSYQLVKVKEGTRAESNPQLTVKGVGYDRSLGGMEMTFRLRDHLAKVFNSQKKRSMKVEDNPRAMAKLLKEAERVKKVLSANNDHKAQVEGLLEGEDFAARVTRDEYLELIKDLLDAVRKPVEDALKVSEITWPEISEIILMGGGSRMPRVQELLFEFSGKSDLGKSINTDEAAALGAVYQAAYLGKGFKVKTFHVRDANIFPINVEFEKQKSAEDSMPAAATKVIKRTLFGRMNPFPQRKVMTFNKHFQDFNFIVRYGDLDFLSEEEKKTFPTTLLMNVSLIGVENALNKHSQMADYKGVKAHFRMDESGVLYLDKVESVFEKQQVAQEDKEDESTWSKIGSAFGGLFGGKEEGPTEEGKTEVPDGVEVPDGDASSQHAETNETETSSNQSGQTQADLDQSDQASSKKSKEESDKGKEEEGEKHEDKSEEEPGEKEETLEKGEEAEQTSSDTKRRVEDDSREGKQEKKKDEKPEAKTKDEDTNTTTKAPSTPKIMSLKEDIKADIEIKYIAEFSEARLKEARKRLADLQKKDQEKTALEKSKNDLEGFIFDTQDKLSQEAYEACSTEEERTAILQQMSAASDWLYEQPEDTKKEVFTNKLKDLKELMKNVKMRVYEKEERPKALAALKQHLNSTKVFLQTVRNMTDEEDPMFTEVELTTLEKLINETTVWRDQAVKEQKKIPDYETPTLLVETIGSKIYALEREMKYLINKAKNYRPKSKTTTSKVNDTTAKKLNQSEESPENENDAEGVVENEDQDADTTAVPETQESSPDSQSMDEKTEDTVKKPDVKKKSKSDKSSKIKQPRKKSKEEVNDKKEEENLELERKDRSTYHPRNIDRDL